MLSFDGISVFRAELWQKHFLVSYAFLHYLLSEFAFFTAVIGQNSFFLPLDEIRVFSDFLRDSLFLCGFLSEYVFFRYSLLKFAFSTEALGWNLYFPWYLTEYALFCGSLMKFAFFYDFLLRFAFFLRYFDKIRVFSAAICRSSCFFSRNPMSKFRANFLKDYIRGRKEAIPSHCYFFFFVAVWFNSVFISGRFLAKYRFMQVEVRLTRL